MSLSDSTFYCVDVGDGSPSRPWCLVDRSSAGARILVDRPSGVPDHFTLVQKGSVVRLWKCRVVWRSSSHVGIEFDAQSTH